MMTKDKALKLALEALINAIAVRNGEGGTKLVSPLEENAITAIKEALAQPEQEPVAWLHWLHGPVHVFLNKDEAMMELDRLNRDYPVDKNARQMKSLYTTPPTRPWVGLTDDERANCWRSSAKQTAINIEAKLKELNT